MCLSNSVQWRFLITPVEIQLCIDCVDKTPAPYSLTNISFFSLPPFLSLYASFSPSSLSFFSALYTLVQKALYKWCCMYVCMYNGLRSLPFLSYSIVVRFWWNVYLIFSAKRSVHMKSKKMELILVALQHPIQVEWHPTLLMMKKHNCQWCDGFKTRFRQKHPPHHTVQMKYALAYR